MKIDSKISIDYLILETLAYLKTQKCFPILNELLERETDNFTKLVIATSIFEINKDSNMIELVIKFVEKMEDIADLYFVYKLIHAFQYLIKFRNEKMNGFIKQYINHKEYLVAYNAKKALKITI